MKLSDIWIYETILTVSILGNSLLSKTVLYSSQPVLNSLIKSRYYITIGEEGPSEDLF